MAATPPSGGLLKRRLGPFPVWVYLVAAAGAGGYVYWRKKQAANAAASSSTTSGTSAESPDASMAVDSGVSPDGAYEGTALDDLESFLAAQEAAGGSSSPTGTGTTTTTTKAPAKPKAKTYRALGSPAAAKAAIKQGKILYIKSANGAYTPVKKGEKLPKGTPEYIEVT